MLGEWTNEEKQDNTVSKEKQNQDTVLPLNGQLNMFG